MSAAEPITASRVMPPPPIGPSTEAYARERARVFSYLEAAVRSHLQSGKGIREIFPSSRCFTWHWTGNPMNFESDDVVNQLMAGFLNFHTELEFLSE